MNHKLKVLSCLILGVLMSGSLVYGQLKDAKVELGTPYRVVDAEIKEFFKVGKNTVISVKKDKKYWYTQVYNATSLKQLKYNEEKLEDKDLVVEKIMEIGDKVNVFYSLWDRKNETEQLFVREVDSETGKLSKAVRVAGIKGKIAGTLTAGRMGLPQVTDKFDFYKSANGSKIVIQYRKKPEIKRDKYNKDIIGFVVIENSSKEVLWKSEVRMPYTEALMDNLDYTVDQKGKVYILTKVYNNDQDRKDDVFHVEIFVLDKGGKDFDKHKVEFDDIFIRSLLIQETKQGEIVCAGYYNKEKQYGQVDGVMTFKINAEGEPTELNKYEIPVEIISQYLSKFERKRNEKKDEKGKEVGFKNLVMRNLVVDQNGGVFLVGEQRYFVVRRSYGSYGSSTVSYQHYFKTVLVTKIDKDGELDWMHAIPKNQTITTSSPVPPENKDLSYTIIEGRDNGINILYIDNVRNLKLKKDEAPKVHASGKGGFLTATKLSTDGEAEKYSIFDVRDIKGMKVYQVEIRRILGVGIDKFVMEVYKKKKEDILIKGEF